MTTADKIKNEKLQHDNDREPSKISALSSGKIDEYEYLTGEEILPPDQSTVIEQVYLFSFTKIFTKQTQKQVDASKSLNLSNRTN